MGVLIFFFAFSSIIGNYYYAESNLRFLTRSPLVLTVYRLTLGAMVMAGAVLSLDVVWGTTDIFMTVMATCNLIAILCLGRYAIRALHDYVSQRRRGLDPVYRRSAIPEIADETTAWPE